MYRFISILQQPRKSDLRTKFMNPIKYYILGTYISIRNDII